MKDDSQNKKGISEILLIIIAVIFMVLGIGLLVFAFNQHIELNDNASEEYTEVIYQTEVQNTTPIKKEIIDENINYETPSDLPPTKLIDVPYINQRAKYPTGCESVSAVMALQFAGYDITPEDFINNFLPKSPAPYIDINGQSLGYNPSKTFLGDPFSKDGWGCYFPVIRRCLYTITDEGRHTVETLYKTPLHDLCYYIDRDIPVIIWATQGMNKTKKSKSWTIVDTGASFTWVSPNHCLLLVGYDDTGYYFNDPLTHKNCRYPADITEKRYNAMGKQALAIVPVEKENIEQY